MLSFLKILVHFKRRTSLWTGCESQSPFHVFKASETAVTLLWNWNVSFFLSQLFLRRLLPTSFLFTVFFSFLSLLWIVYLWGFLFVKVQLFNNCTTSLSYYWLMYYHELIIVRRNFTMTYMPTQSKLTIFHFIPMKVGVSLNFKVIEIINAVVCEESYTRFTGSTETHNNIRTWADKLLERYKLQILPET